MKPISVGDLVMVVKPTICCGNSQMKDYIFVVSALLEENGWCLHCGQIHGQVLRAFGNNGKRPIQISRLKRTPPLSELESTDQHEEVFA